MRAGRPPWGKVDLLVSQIQYRFLRLALSAGDRELSVWLRSLVQGGMNDRDARAFLGHRSQISAKHAKLIDVAAPGLYWLTMYPWRVLHVNEPFITNRLLNWFHKRLGEAMMDRRDHFEERLRLADPHYRPVGNGDEWFALEAFFYTLIEYRRKTRFTSQDEKNQCACSILAILEDAFAHPVVCDTQRDLLMCIVGLFSRTGAVWDYSVRRAYALLQIGLAP